SLYPEAQYAFRHPLTHEVAYRSQLAECRARIHGAVARAIAELHPDRLDERAALLANHWENAGAFLEAARWNRRAADWVRSSDAAATVQYWGKVRALLRKVTESDETMALGLTGCMTVLQFGWRAQIRTALARAWSSAR